MTAGVRSQTLRLRRAPHGATLWARRGNASHEALSQLGAERLFSLSRRSLSRQIQLNPENQRPLRKFACNCQIDGGLPS